MYTIQREVGHLHKVRIGLVGDLANGRTVRSLAYLLSMYDDVKMYFVAPDVVRMKDDIKEFLTGRCCRAACRAAVPTPWEGGCTMYCRSTRDAETVCRVPAQKTLRRAVRRGAVFPRAMSERASDGATQTCCATASWAAGVQGC